MRMISERRAGPLRRLPLLALVAAVGVVGSCSDACGCSPLPPWFQVVGRVVDEGGSGVGGVQLTVVEGSAGNVATRSTTNGYFGLNGPAYDRDLSIDVSPPAGFELATGQEAPVHVTLLAGFVAELEIRLRRQAP
ncbi:MAG TPA: hypothetical protein VFQ38_13765 [Longimicrobiales bacterium]|nr:hypothetical protein [Longimicrobiales bacterium]